jgi:hypothetical protein
MAFSSEHHTFDIKLAAKYGVEEAILIRHFIFWIRLNRAQNKGIKEGKCWTRQARKEILAQFPYWNYDKIKYLCEKLVALGILMTEKYNKNPIDKTLSYAFVDEASFGVSEEDSKNLYEGQKCPSKGKSAPPIEDINNKIYIKPPIPLAGDIPPTSQKEEQKKTEKEEVKEKRIEREEHITTTEREHKKLIDRYGPEKTIILYKMLSMWKNNASEKDWKKSDYLSILTWVVDKYAENERKNPLWKMKFQESALIAKRKTLEHDLKERPLPPQGLVQKLLDESQNG